MDATDQRMGTLRRGIGLALIALMAFGAMAGGAAAHTSNEHGTLTLHDSPDGPPTTSLECEFWVKGHNMTHQNGTLHLEHHQADHLHVHELGDWQGTQNESGGWDFESGSHTHNASWGNQRALTSLNTSQDERNRSHSVYSPNFDYTTCEESEQQEQRNEDEQAQPPACPEDLRAQAHGNEDVTLGWNASADADSYHVYRATEDGEMTHVAEVNATSYTDTETQAQTTYTYEVTAANEAGEAEDCPTAEVTAIPFFGSPALVAMAALGSVGAVGALRVRRG